MQKLLTAISVAVLAAASIAPASATTIVALTGDATIVRINLESRTVTGTSVVASAPFRIAGIDVRPADAQLYGLFTNSNIVRINPNTGARTFVSMVDPEASIANDMSVDFNPVPDRLRVIGRDGLNLRINVDTGATSFDSFTNPTNVVAAAYSNSFAVTTMRPAPTTTALIDIVGGNTLAVQSPPNSGAVVTIVPLPFFLGTFGFDISLDAAGRNRLWVVGSGRLLEIDPVGGRILSNQAITGLTAVVRDIAILP